MKHLISFAFVLFAQASVAGETICFRENCLANGWTLNTIPYATVTQCKMGSCPMAGWVVTNNIGARSEVVCRGPGCFSGGWTETHFGLKPDEQTYCKYGNCLVYGWQTWGYPNLDVTCIGGDCQRYGWQMVTSQGYVVTIQCKGGNCFRYGWITTP